MVMNSDGGYYLWQYLKPLLRGKIVYAPDNDITRQIVREANATFDRIAIISKTLKAMVKTNNDLMSRVDDSDIEKIKVTVFSLISSNHLTMVPLFTYFNIEPFYLRCATV